MNFVYLSPHFPPNYAAFCVELQRAGVTVLGVGDTPYESLQTELRAALAEYYRVGDLSDYDQLLRALGHLTHRHGRLDRIDSQSEHWLETEAHLRTDFNLPGLRADAIADVKRKSRMKEIYRRAGVPVARGAVVHTLGEALGLAATVGYPLVAKPDVGVGAAGTAKLHNPEELAAFFARKPPVDYLLEEFIQGRLFSFDGLTDRDGRVVFCAAHAFSQGIMETVNEDRDLFYHSLRQIPADLEEAGRRTVAAFGVRERFFHLEFFRTDRDGAIVALEVNLRPPGGLTTDMFNYANDLDIYREWAQVVAHNRFTAQAERPYHCGYAGRKQGKDYARSHGEVVAALGAALVHHTPIDSIFRGAIGDYGYLVRSPNLDEVTAAARFIQEPA